jgi:type II secretory pathway pseudopilin PulG
MSIRARKRARARHQRGAAVLMLLLLFMLAGAATLSTAYGGSQRSAREREALRVLADAREALLGFAILHGRLPRPAVAPDSGTELPYACDSEQRCTGYLPWIALGLPPAYARGQPLRYSVTPAFANDGVTLSMAVATKTISWRHGAQLAYLRGARRCAREAQCVPAVLIASGKAQAAGAGDQAANAHASVDFIQRPHSDDERDAGAGFDDIIAWVPYIDLRIRMLLAGRWQ